MEKEVSASESKDSFFGEFTASLSEAYSFLWKRVNKLRRHPDQTYAMIKGEIPYKRGKVKETVCKPRENLDKIRYERLITETYKEPKDVACVSLGLKEGENEKAIEILEE
ncbi:MAG: hypothetical protein ACLFS3_03265, partial [Candidatus Aenigmatarchaeota archaeon]